MFFLTNLIFISNIIGDLPKTKSFAANILMLVFSLHGLQVEHTVHTGVSFTSNQPHNSLKTQTLVNRNIRTTIRQLCLLLQKNSSKMVLSQQMSSAKSSHAALQCRVKLLCLG